MMFTRATLALLSLALGAAAQSSSASGTSAAPSATPSISACILQCLTSSQSSSTCTSYTDLPCTCKNSGYQTAVATCIASACPDQLGDATTLQATECNNVSSSASGSGSGTSTAPSSSKTSGSSSTTSAGSSSTSSSAAGALVVEHALGGVAGAAIVGVVGLVFGGLML